MSPVSIAPELEVIFGLFSGSVIENGPKNPPSSMPTYNGPVRRQHYVQLVDLVSIQVVCRHIVVARTNFDPHFSFYSQAMNNLSQWEKYTHRCLHFADHKSTPTPTLTTISPSAGTIHPTTTTSRATCGPVRRPPRVGRASGRCTEHARGGLTGRCGVHYVITWLAAVINNTN